MEKPGIGILLKMLQGTGQNRLCGKAIFHGHGACVTTDLILVNSFCVHNVLTRSPRLIEACHNLRKWRIFAGNVDEYVIWASRRSALLTFQAAYLDSTLGTGKDTRLF